MSHDSKKIDLLNMALHSSIELDPLPIEEIIGVLLFNEKEVTEFSIPSVDCYCVKCGMQTTFKSKSSDRSLIEVLHHSYFAHIRSMDESRLDFYNTLNKVGIYTRSFYCPRLPNDSSHDLDFVFRVSEKKLIKIGQYPALADVENTHLLKYKKLDNDLYKELNRGVGLFSHGIGVGAFVYLRRIVEKYIVQPELDKMVESKELENEQLMRIDFKEKVRLAKEHLPEDLVSNTNVYSILSKGIHSLTEAECKQIFPPLLTIIELMLDDKLEQIEKEEKRNKLRNELGKISGNI